MVATDIAEVTYLGIDVGTSALKAVLVDDRQRVIGTAVIPLTVRNDRPGWSEQDPDDWWAALLRAIDHLRGACPDGFRQVQALGLSGQMHGAVLVDRTGTAIRPAILWNDNRAAAECEELRLRIPDLPLIAGIEAMPGFTAPKLLWLSLHEPEAFGNIWKVLSPKDYLRLRLTGAAVTDMSDAAGTLWLDQAERRWSAPIVEASKLGLSQLPELLEGTASSGDLRPAVLRAWGLAGPVVVAAGAGDAAAAAIGLGAVESGAAFVSLGTSAQLFITDDRYRPQPGTTLHAFAHALPQRWFRMAAMLNGASCLQWAASLVGDTDLDGLVSRTEAGFSGPSRLLFLPYLSGERTPHNDPAARGVFFGLDTATSRTDLIQATLEGVVFSLVEAKHLLMSAGVDLTSIAAVGGGARSRFWMQILAHALGLPVIRYAGSETGPAFGAARLARLAATGEPAEEVCARPAILDRLESDPALHEAYADRFVRYRRLYRALKNEFVPPAQQQGRSGRGPRRGR